MALHHVLVAAAGIGAGPAELFEIREEIAALNRADWRHQAATPTLIAIPSIGGISYHQSSLASSDDVVRSMPQGLLIVWR